MASHDWLPSRPSIRFQVSLPESLILGHPCSVFRNSKKSSFFVVVGGQVGGYLLLNSVGGKAEVGGTGE